MLADSDYQNEKDVANTYKLSNGNMFVTVYYQPVISAKAFENELTLFRTTITTRKNYYTPDFVLKFFDDNHDDNHNEEYAVFDSKFSSRENIKKHSLDEVILKYSSELASTAKINSPKMVWILQGRVNSNENPIWKYHNSPLVSSYLPATSYGIASVNTSIDIKQRLWNELKRCISLL